MNALLQLSWNSAGGFRLPDQWVWCGSAVRSDGKYCLFAACWPSTFPMLEGYLLSSRIVLAVSDTPEGPYRYRYDIAPEPGSGLRMAHNPTVLRRDGRYYLYFIGSTYPGAELVYRDMENRIREIPNFWRRSIATSASTSWNPTLRQDRGECTRNRFCNRSRTRGTPRW